MKGIKLSKTGWLILSAGIFIVMLAGLGLTRSQQMQDQELSTEELTLAARRLDNLDVTALRNEVQSLQEQIDLGKADLADAINRLDKSVISADVAEDFYDLALVSGVSVHSFTSSPIVQDTLEGIPVSQTAVSGSVEGTLEQIIDFIINVNTSFRTGYIQSATIALNPPVSPELDLDAMGGGSIQMIIYSYTEAAEE